MSSVGGREQAARSAKAGERVEIILVTTPAELVWARDLFLEYGRSLDSSVCLGGLAEEVAGLPGAYGPPGGVLLLARVGDKPAGCGGLRPLAADVAELKRLYVRPEYRGCGIGRQLATRLVAEARALGYRWLRLDTLPSMAAAQALYRTLGFSPIRPYAVLPCDAALCFELELATGAA